MGSIDPQISGFLVDLIFHEVERSCLDVDVYQAGWIGPHLEAVPRVGSPTIEWTGKTHFWDVPYL